MPKMKQPTKDVLRARIQELEAERAERARKSITAWKAITAINVITVGVLLWGWL